MYPIPPEKFLQIISTGHTYDALLAEEKDAANRQKLMQQANNAIAEMLKKETQDTLDKVLFELSSQMKNAYSRSDA